MSEEKRILKALGNLYTIIEFNKVELLSDDCGLYVDAEGKFCAIGAIMPPKLLRYAHKQEAIQEESDITSIITYYSNSEVSPEAFCIALFGFTLGEAGLIQRDFDCSCVGENRLKAVEDLIEVYETKLDTLYAAK